MKAAPFDYVRAESLSDAYSLLNTYREEARVIAGGQRLLASLNMRLSEPALLVDINGIDELKGITVSDGHLRIGALTRHSEIAESPLVAQHAPLLTAAAPHVAHQAIRNRGTFGGSLAFADPAAEWPACVVALDADIVVQSESRQRRISARDFFIDLYVTALEPGELIIACEVPLPQADQRFAFDELARRHGDYAIVGLAAAAQVRKQSLYGARFVFLGTGTTPVRATRAEAALEGQQLSARTLDLARQALAEELNPLSDLYNSAAAKLHMAGVLLARTAHRLTTQ
jgi:aerobic carbon-monoxide dehydrogenase medium subunit